MSLCVTLGQHYSTKAFSQGRSADGRIPCPSLSSRSIVPPQPLSAFSYLRVYRMRPSFQIRSMRLGVVIQWASAFLELRKKVSGIQIFPTMLLLRRRTFIVLLNFNLRSYHVWAKKMSMVYSWWGGGRKQMFEGFTSYKIVRAFFYLTWMKAFLNHKVMISRQFHKAYGMLHVSLWIIIICLTSAFEDIKVGSSLSLQSLYFTSLTFKKIHLGEIPPKVSMCFKPLTLKIAWVLSEAETLKVLFFVDNSWLRRKCTFIIEM